PPAFYPLSLHDALPISRTQAIVKAKPEVFTLDVKARSYTAPGKSPHTLPEHMRLSITSAAEDQQADKLARIRFFPDGSSTGGHRSEEHTSELQSRFDIV